jgi:group I intron endonuclease
MGSIYSISNTITSAVYIGSTVRAAKVRWGQHRKELRAGIHHSRFLQRAWNKYGEDAFVFEIIEEVADNDSLLSREQQHLDSRRTEFARSKTYNVCWIAGSCAGFIPSAATRAKWSRARRGKKRSAESRAAQVAAWDKKHQHQLVSPNGVLFKFGNTREFARKHNLCPASIGLVLRRKLRYFKGWSRPDGHRFAFIDPNGVIHDGIVILSEFCAQHGLNMKCMSGVFSGAKLSYKGWKKWGNCSVT